MPLSRAKKLLTEVPISANILNFAIIIMQNIFAGRKRKGISLIKEDSDDVPGYTNWRYACYRWNLENDLIPMGYKDYFSSKYDHDFDIDQGLKETYVPPTQGMPDTWIYDPPKRKNKPNIFKGNKHLDKKELETKVLKTKKEDKNLIKYFFNEIQNMYEDGINEYKKDSKKYSDLRDGLELIPEECPWTLEELMKEEVEVLISKLKEK